MKITSLRQYKGTTIEAELDSERKIYLHIDIVTDFGLCSGMELDSTELKKIIYASNFRRAYQYALHLLDYRDYSYREMFLKLEKTYKNENMCFAVMKRLVQNSFIDDVRYGEKLARRYIEVRRYGLRRARREMIAKGIAPEAADNVLDSYGDRAEENLAYLLENKYSRLLTDKADRKATEKVKSALVRYGYGFDEINIAIREYFENADIQNENQF